MRLSLEISHEVTVFRPLFSSIFTKKYGPMDPSNTPPASTDVSAMEVDILQLINVHRTGLKLPPLAFYAPIQSASQQHSNNMATGSVPFGHTGFSERANRLVNALRGSAAAENVAIGQRSAQEVVQSWLNSAQHRQNIEGDFNLTGISAIRDSNGDWVFTQLFIKAPSPSATTLSNDNGNAEQQLNYQIHDRINQHRIQQYLPALQINPHIQVVAVQHAQDMANGKVGFGHQGFEDRARLLLGKLGGKSAAENVALAPADAHKIVQNWLESSGHRNNIEGHFNLTGIGIAKGSDGRVYCCQLFIER